MEFEKSLFRIYEKTLEIILKNESESEFQTYYESFWGSRSNIRENTSSEMLFEMSQNLLANPSSSSSSSAEEFSNRPTRTPFYRRMFYFFFNLHKISTLLLLEFFFFLVFVFTLLLLIYLHFTFTLRVGCLPYKISDELKILSLQSQTISLSSSNNSSYNKVNSIFLNSYNNEIRQEFNTTKRGNKNLHFYNKNFNTKNKIPFSDLISLLEYKDQSLDYSSISSYSNETFESYFNSSSLLDKEYLSFSELNYLIENDTNFFENFYWDDDVILAIKMKTRVENPFNFKSYKYKVLKSIGNYLPSYIASIFSTETINPDNVSSENVNLVKNDTEINSNNATTLLGENGSFDYDFLASTSPYIINLNYQQLLKSSYKIVNIIYEGCECYGGSSLSNNIILSSQSLDTMIMNNLMATMNTGGYMLNKKGVLYKWNDYDVKSNFLRSMDLIYEEYEKKTEVLEEIATDDSLSPDSSDGESPVGGQPYYSNEYSYDYQSSILNKKLLRFNKDIEGLNLNFNEYEQYRYRNFFINFCMMVVFKLRIIITSYMLFFLSASITALLVRVLITSGVAIIFPFVFAILCCRAYFKANNLNNQRRVERDNQRIIRRNLRHNQRYNNSSSSSISSNSTINNNINTIGGTNSPNPVENSPNIRNGPYRVNFESVTRISIEQIIHGYPWLGLPLKEIYMSSPKPSTLVVNIMTHLMKIMMYYYMYMSVQTLSVIMFYSTSPIRPAGEIGNIFELLLKKNDNKNKIIGGIGLGGDVYYWIFVIMMLWEYYSIIFLRSRGSIFIFPKFCLAVFMMFHFYYYNCSGGFFAFSFLPIFFLSVFFMLHLIRIFELKSFSHGNVTIDKPRIVYNSFPWRSWAPDLPSDFTVFMPPNTIETSLYNERIPSISVSVSNNEIDQTNTDPNLQPETSFRSTTLDSMNMITTNSQRTDISRVSGIAEDSTRFASSNSIPEDGESVREANDLPSTSQLSPMSSASNILNVEQTSSRSSYNQFFNIFFNHNSSSQACRYSTIEQSQPVQAHSRLSPPTSIPNLNPSLLVRDLEFSNSSRSNRSNPPPSPLHPPPPLPSFILPIPDQPQSLSQTQATPQPFSSSRNFSSSMLHCTKATNSTNSSTKTKINPSSSLKSSASAPTIGINSEKYSSKLKKFKREATSPDSSKIFESSLYEYSSSSRSRAENINSEKLPLSPNEDSDEAED